MAVTESLERRRMLGLALAAGAVCMAGSASAQTAAIPARPFVAAPIRHPIPRTSRPLKIGVIGSGNIGGTIGELFWKSGHQLMFADRDPAAAKAQADRMSGARTGTPEEAIAFADVLLMAAPYGAWPDIARQYGAALRGKIVLDPTNFNPTRDAVAVPDPRASGTGLAVAAYLPGVRLVRAFNTSGYATFAQEANRPGAKMGIPVASDDAAALAIGVQLISDVGFDPVSVGGLANAGRFENGGPASGVKTAAELRTLMGVAG
jgi:predicted dinucleotide-binding enzyme